MHHQKTVQSALRAYGWEEVHQLGYNDSMVCEQNESHGLVRM